ncbi:MAG: hypothetical protein KKF77_10155 [Proteobacteria bacterium]|nr:hypothetical protein [Pseudomonadota bacterium]
MRNLAHALALAALVLAVPVLTVPTLATPALAVGPDAPANAQPAPSAQPAANLATAAKAVMNPADTVEALNKNIRASQEQNQAAISALNQAGSTAAQSTPAPRPGGGKVMYGDIIIHK